MIAQQRLGTLAQTFAFCSTILLATHALIRYAGGDVSFEFAIAEAVSISCLYAFTWSWLVVKFTKES